MIPARIPTLQKAPLAIKSSRQLSMSDVSLRGEVGCSTTTRSNPEVLSMISSTTSIVLVTVASRLDVKRHVAACGFAIEQDTLII